MLAIRSTISHTFVHTRFTVKVTITARTEMTEFLWLNPPSYQFSSKHNFTELLVGIALLLDCVRVCHEAETLLIIVIQLCQLMIYYELSKFEYFSTN